MPRPSAQRSFPCVPRSECFLPCPPPVLKFVVSPFPPMNPKLGDSEVLKIM